MSTTIDDLAHELADKHGTDFDYTATSLTLFLEQCAAVDGVHYDHADVPDETADFIAKSFAMGLTSDGQAERALGELQEVAARYRAAVDELDAVRDMRKQAVLKARAAGATAPQIKDAGDFASLSHVHKLLKGQA